MKSDGRQESVDSKAGQGIEVEVEVESGKTIEEGGHIELESDGEDECKDDDEGAATERMRSLSVLLLFLLLRLVPLWAGVGEIRSGILPDADEQVEVEVKSVKSEGDTVVDSVGRDERKAETVRLPASLFLVDELDDAFDDAGIGWDTGGGERG